MAPLRKDLRITIVLVLAITAQLAATRDDCDQGMFLLQTSAKVSRPSVAQLHLLPSTLASNRSQGAEGSKLHAGLLVSRSNAFSQRDALICCGLVTLVLGFILGLCWNSRGRSGKTGEEAPPASGETKAELLRDSEVTAANINQDVEESSVAAVNSSAAGLTPSPRTADEAALEASMAAVGLVSRTLQLVGPKVSKGRKVLRDVVQKRINNLQARAQQIVLSELEGAAGELCDVMGAPEVMVVGGSSSIETSLPPLPGLARGAASPVLLQAGLWSHVVQIVSLLPIICLCLWAIIREWDAICRPMPWVTWWLVAMVLIGGSIALARFALIFMIWRGRRSLMETNAEAAAHAEARSMESSVADMEELRGLIVDYAVLFSKALLVEAEVARSRWNFVIGAGTCLWVICVVWNLWEVLEYAFVPGRMDFNSIRKDSLSYCASWRSILVCRIVAVLTGGIFLLNLITVVLWIIGLMMEQDGFATRMLRAARAFDRSTTHLPVAQLLCQSVFMPPEDVEQVRLLRAQQQQRLVEHDLAKSEEHLQQLQTKLAKQKAMVSKLQKAKAESEIHGVNAAVGGDLENFEKMLRKSMDPQEWHRAGEEAVRRALEAAPSDPSITMPSTEHLQRLSAEVQSLSHRVQESESFLSAQGVASSSAQRARQMAQTIQESEALQTAQASAIASSERARESIQNAHNARGSQG